MANPAEPTAPQTAYAAIAARAAKKPAGAPTGTATIASPLDLTYTWDYASTRPELRILYEKSKDLMWNASAALPWDTQVDPEAENVADSMNPIFGTPIWNKLDPKKDIPNLRRNMAAYMLSNFLHGEQGALLATAQIVDAAPTADAKLYAAAQVFDEARHVEAYDRYLREKIELIYPPTKPLRELLDHILGDRRWDFKFLGMQIMVEGLALGAFGLLHQMSNEPLIRQITQNIMQDEARHVAFGVLTLKDFYRDMPANELRDREDFVVTSARLLRDRFLGQDVWERMGFPQKECEEATLRSESYSMFRRLLFSKIVPNVKRLGLLTPYVRKGFEELDILEFESWEASA
jgi:para-aminobenzoate N-oxygenase AurF